MTPTHPPPTPHRRPHHPAPPPHAPCGRCCPPSQLDDVHGHRPGRVMPGGRSRAPPRRWRGGRRVISEDKTERVQYWDRSVQPALKYSVSVNQLKMTHVQLYYRYYNKKYQIKRETGRLKRRMWDPTKCSGSTGSGSIFDLTPNLQRTSPHSLGPLLVSPNERPQEDLVVTAFGFASCRKRSGVPPGTSRWKGPSSVEDAWRWRARERRPPRRKAVAKPRVNHETC